MVTLHVPWPVQFNKNQALRREKEELCKWFWKLDFPTPGAFLRNALDSMLLSLNVTFGVELQHHNTPLGYNR